MELDYSMFNDNLTDNKTGLVTKQKTDTFNQNYNVNLTLDPYPNLSILSGVIITSSQAKTTANDVTTNDHNDSVRPYFDIRLHDPLNIYYAETAYSIQKSTTSGTNVQTQTLYNETYNGSFGWTPVAFPTLPLPTFGVLATQSNMYDQDRQFINITTDTIQYNTRWVPLPTLNVSYSGIYTKETDRINQLDVNALNQTARADYTDSFWQRRIVFSTAYVLGYNNTDTSTQGKGTVSIPLFPFAGLSNVTNIPTPDTLTPNPALIDGNTTVSANINIGSGPTLATGDTNFREMGLDFGVATNVNTLLIWVNQQLAPVIANSFVWDIYTSSDNVNWTLIGTIPSAPFGPFVNNFSLSFNTVSTRYIKVATRPLALTVPGATAPNNQNIFVTEMQASITQSAQTFSGSTTEESQMFSVNVSTKIIEGLYEVFSYNTTKSSFTSNGASTSSSSYSMSNSLNFARHLDIVPWLTAAARFSRDDNVNSFGPSQYAYNWSATLSAVPFRSLRGSLVYSGTEAGNGYSANNLSLSVVADLYQGVSLSSTGTVGSAISSTGVKTDGTQFLAALGITPRRDLSLHVNYQNNNGSQYGGNMPVGTQATLESWDGGGTYRPFDTVYLTADYGEVRRTGVQNQITQSYGFNWSPLLSGNLQLNFSFNEGRQNYLDSVTRTYGPTLTWRLITPATLSVSYFVTENKSSLANETIDNLYAQFQLFF